MPINDQPTPLPPAIAILLSENLTGKPGNLKRRFSRSSLIRDLQEQALWSLTNYSYKPVAPTEFGVVPPPSLDPLSRVMRCPHPDCIEGAVTGLAQTLALYADTVLVPDTITPLLAGSDRTLPEDVAFHVFSNAIALKVLQPLIDAGVVRFFLGEQFFCSHHLRQFDRNVVRVARETAKQALPNVSVVPTQRGFEVNSESLFTPLLGIASHVESDEALERLRNKKTLRAKAMRLLVDHFADTIRESALELFAAEKANATYVLDSPIVASALNSPKLAYVLTTKRPGDDLASLKLPWISDLTIPEALELRNNAEPALGRLRALLRAALQAGKKPATVTAELREQAAEIEAELRALPLTRERQFRATAAGLGLTLSLVAAATGPFPAAAVGAGGTLLSLLSLLHGMQSKTSHEVSRLHTKPGYVLLRAKELIARRQHP
jgi:hypothetical protein